jgi:acetyl esterase/lipase
MVKYLQGLLARLKEPSTHASLAVLALVASNVAVQHGVDPHVIAQAGEAAGATFGVLGALLPEVSGS